MGRNHNVDINILVNDEVFSTHKELLQKYSTYFHEKLAGECRGQDSIRLHNVDEIGVEICIELMYYIEEVVKESENQVSRDFMKLTKALQAADVLGMQVLQDVFQKAFCRITQAEDGLELVEILREYGTKDFITTARQIVKRNIEKVARQPRFLDINETDFLYYISESDAHAVVVWKIIERWISHDKARDVHTYDAINILLSMKEDITPLFPDILQYPPVRSTFRCTDRVSQELKSRSENIRRILNPSLSGQLLCSFVGLTLDGIDDIQEAAIKCVAWNMKNCTAVYQKLCVEYFHDVLQVQVPHERLSKKEKWEAVVTWVKQDISRSRHALKLLKTMDLQKRDLEFIRTHMRSETFVEKSVECVNFLLDLSLDAALEPHPDNMKATQCNLAMLDTGWPELTVWNIQEKTTAKIKLPESKFPNTARIASLRGGLFLQYGGNILKLKEDGSWLKVFYNKAYKSTWVQFVSFTDKLAVVTKDHTILYEYDQTKIESRVNGCKLGTGFSSTGSSTCMYAVGGYASSSKAKKYTDADGWFDLPQMPISISHPGTACFEQKLYVIGGLGVVYKQRAVVCFDGVKWVTVNPMVKARAKCAAIAHDGRIYVVGGANGYFEFVEEYGKESADWKKAWQVKATKGVVSLAVCNLSPSHYHFLP